MHCFSFSSVTLVVALEHFLIDFRFIIWTIIRHIFVQHYAISHRKNVKACINGVL
jgi:hypothetical protein